MLNGVPLTKVSQFKYVCHCFADNLKDDADVERKLKALVVQANMLAPKFSRCTAAVKLAIITAYRTSLYSSALWANC